MALGGGAVAIALLSRSGSDASTRSDTRTKASVEPTPSAGPEPSASLDLGSRERLMQALSGFAQSPSSPAMVMVTHHVEEIPPGFTHVLMLRDGHVTASGPLAEALTADTLEATSGLPFTLTMSNGRYSAVARD